MTNRVDDPKTRHVVLIVLQRMQTNVFQVQSAMQTLQQTLNSTGTAIGTRAPQAKKELRDSILSLIIAMGFIERHIGGPSDVERLANLAGRASTAAVGSMMRL